MALSRERILEAAFQQADEKGLDSVTMRSVAGRLGVEAMSLYHHVPNKKAMMDGLVDQLVQVAALPTGDITAEAWIRGAAAGLRALAQEHPRLIPAFSLRAVPLHDATSARPFEAGLAAFTRSGHTLLQSYAAIQSVLLSLLSMAELEAAASADLEEAEQSALGTLSQAEFPLLHEVLTSEAGLDEFWQTLVDGLVKGLATP